MTNQLDNIPCQKDLIYDLGLHLGEDTDFYLKKGFRVVAFEANPLLVDAARKRFSDAIEKGRLVIVEGAIVAPDAAGSMADTIAFYENSDLSVWGTINRSWAERNERLGHKSKVIEVPVTDLEKAIVEYGMPYYMKIDIEGCDMICLRTLEKFRVRPCYISFESDKTSVAAIRSEIDLLARLGYNRFQPVEQSSICKVQHPPRPPLEGRHVDHRFESGSSGLFGAELPDKWCGAREVKRRYAFIRLGSYLLGDDGIMKPWRFTGARLLRGLARFAIRTVTGSPVPGWYDTHAQHADAGVRPIPPQVGQ
jgi:FkbM family methyltransferase